MFLKIDDLSCRCVSIGVVLDGVSDV